MSDKMWDINEPPNCPFCGGHPIQVQRLTGLFVTCEIGCTGYMEIHHWINRPIEDALLANVVAAEKALAVAEQRRQALAKEVHELLKIIQPDWYLEKANNGINKI